MNENNENNVFEENEIKEEKKEFNLGREIAEWVISIAVAFVIALFLRNYIVTLVRVDGASMEKTLLDSQRLIVTRIGYTPEAGDVVIFTPANGSKTPYIKRVIATEGQSITLERSGDAVNVYVDGELLEEDYAYVSNAGQYNIGEGSYTVPENCVFVMGDNRCNSHDSRSRDVGFVSIDSIMGEAVFRIWPLNTIGTV